MRIIDISQPLRCGNEIGCAVPAALPVYEGLACEEYQFSFASHTGCYFETEGHLFRGGRMTADVPLGRLFLPAVIARLNPGRRDAIAGEEIETALPGPLEAGEALLIDTRGQPNRFFARAAASWMAAQGVSLVGATLPRYDTGFVKPTGVFREWFEAGIPVLAGLQNLEAVTADRAFLIVLPLAIERVATAPCRAVILEGEPSEVAWLTRALRAEPAP